MPLVVEEPVDCELEDGLRRDIMACTDDVRCEQIVQE
jgi:hypothetical protein